MFEICGNEGSRSHDTNMIVSSICLRFLGRMIIRYDCSWHIRFRLGNFPNVLADFEQWSAHRNFSAMFENKQNFFKVILNRYSIIHIERCRSAERTWHRKLLLLRRWTTLQMRCMRSKYISLPQICVGPIGSAFETAEATSYIPGGIWTHANSNLVKCLILGGAGGQKEHWSHLPASWELECFERVWRWSKCFNTCW